MSQRIYLDYNASTPLDPRVLESMLPYLSGVHGNASSVHQEGKLAHKALKSAREQIAGVLGVEEQEVFFNSGCTEANNLVLYSALRNPRSHIITTAIEHPSVLRSCLDLQERRLVDVTILPVGKDGILDADSVRPALRPNTTLISVMAANNETGALQPVKEVGGIAHEHGIAFHCDATQMCGKGPMNPREWNADYVTFTAHKFYGPKGAGLLYRRKGAPWQSWLLGGGQEGGVRAGTENLACIVGMAKALELCQSPEEWEAVRTLRNNFWEMLSQRVSNLILNTRLDRSVGNTLNVGFQGVSSDPLLLSLDLRGIAVSAGSACHTASREPSHVLLAMGLTPNQARSVLRFSLGRWTKWEDLQRVVEVVAASVGRLRQTAAAA